MVGDSLDTINGVHKLHIDLHKQERVDHVLADSQP